MQAGRVVVVTGMGAVTPFGVGVPALRRGLLGESEAGFAVKTIAPLSSPIIHAGLPMDDLAAIVKAFAPLLPEAASLAWRLVRRAERPVQAMAAAVLEAWAMAGLSGGAPCPDRASVVLAAQNATTGQHYRLGQSFRDNSELVSPNWGVAFMDSFPLGIVSEMLGLTGEGATMGGASASGNVALIQAARMITCGVADLCVVAAPSADLSPLEWQAFRNLGALGGAGFDDAPAQACRPFDKAANGFVPGEAAAALVLEAWDTALARGARPLAVLAGGAVAMSGVSHTAPDLAAELRAMRQALERAGMEPAEVDAVSAHATSTPLGDQTEAEALRALFGEGRVAVNAPKGLLGHALWSAGLVEAVAAVVQMSEGFLHPNQNLTDPISDGLDLVGAKPRHGPLRAMLSNSFGFSGIHTSVVLRGAE